MTRKELLKAIALATGISVATGVPAGAADLHPEYCPDDPKLRMADCEPQEFEPATGPGPGGGGGGFEGC